MSAVTFFAGVATGLILAVLAYLIVRRELAIYARASGRMVDLTHLSREDSRQ